jgi:hypothetical protein
MDVTILGKKASMPVVSVVLQGGATDTIYMFHCYNCQNRLFQYMGKVISICAGSSPNTTPIFIRCERCKKVYQIVDIL